MGSFRRILGSGAPFRISTYIYYDCFFLFFFRFDFYGDICILLRFFGEEIDILGKGDRIILAQEHFSRIFYTRL